MGLRRLAAILALPCAVLFLTSCLARRRVITRNKTATPQALLNADKEWLLQRIETQYKLMDTLNATVDMAPAVGSVNKGQITEYKDVRAYILFKKPSDIRIIGLYPVVRTKAFDMASTGAEFRVFLPSKNRFLVGRTEPLAVPSANKLENLRPSVFLDALLIRPPGANETAVVEDLTDEDNAVYIVHFVYTGPEGPLYLARNVWFDRLKLHIIRQIIFNPKGDILTDARYSDWRGYDGVPFPKVIDINRPQDEYGVVITVVKADINKPIGDEKFALEQPEGTVLQVLGSKQEERPAGAESSASRKKQNTN
jgi:hypothetical protein